jgi:hypothetical protein
MPESKLVGLIIVCGGCGASVMVTNAEFTAEKNECWGCRTKCEDFYTCMCEADSKTLSFQCPTCKYYGTIGVT